MTKTAKNHSLRGKEQLNKKASVDRKATDGKICPVAEKCGGCQWIHRDYQEQLAAKATIFRKLMEPYCRPEPMIAMENPAHYRNKVHAVFGEDRRSHAVISGIYEEKSHRIVPVDSCLIENRKADAIIVSIRKLAWSFKLRPYNEDTGYGLLRHVLIRTGHVTGEIMVVLVLASPIMPSKNNFVKALRKLHPEITTVVVNVNNRDTSMVLGTKEQVIYGKGYIEDELCGRRFRISPRSFYQVNPVQTEKLYGKAMEYARLTGKETVLDAYCGTGTIGMAASEHAGKVLGVELNADAVRDARFNVKNNQISNMEIYQNDAGKFMLDMAEQGHKLDVLFMDPPRSGSDETFLNAVCRVRPGRVVYISCNPETLARDLKYLKKHGYAVKKSTPVDMFPFTDAIESVTLLEDSR
ncbi:MAG: 23S rRNA (uracil(1939)-C(5))-methyltransferase RlmD [Blautia sp.]|nr:23S rRNA (uracil(1939)-C(5))-methyltransferase RlmD [Blautia sp.]